MEVTHTGDHGPHAGGTGFAVTGCVWPVPKHDHKEPEWVLPFLHCISRQHLRV